MQKESTIVITAGVPRSLRDSLAEEAERNMHSMAAEVRRALQRHVEERARAGLPGADAPASSEAGAAARSPEPA